MSIFNQTRTEDYEKLYSSNDDNLNDFDKDDQTLEVERDLLLNNDTLISRFILEDKLMDKDIPSWPSMIDNILKCARDMAQNKEFEGYKVLHMHARVDTIVDEFDELLPEHDEDEIEEFPDDVEVEPIRVPAIESAIEKLERIKID
ncbi:hypothetical protein Pint_16454 [Pistacia integerrima]|uniref:Uncharacterized protein n=1 Tax=Pistacia integerrima TaxID=434235 RepID=A0ACC0ZD73_9ROSI|nr:hypothetical protein Pint_16454 [Pistacia integerrima]